MQYVDRPSVAVILVSSSQYCSLADVFLSTKSDRITVLPLCTPCSRCYMSTERPQPVTLVQPSNRLGCGKVPYTDVFLSLEQANIISESIDDPYHTNIQTNTRNLGNIATFPTSCDTCARRQLLVFPSSTACIATDRNAQLSQHDSVLIALKPTTGGILLALTLTAAASTIPKCSCVKYLRQTSRPPRFCIVGIRSMACPISQLITAETSSTRWLPVRSYSCPSRLLFVHTKQSPTCMSLNL